LLDGRTNLHDPERELGTLTEETALRGRRVEQRAALELPLTERIKMAFSADGSTETLARQDGAASSAAKASALVGVARLDWKFWREASLFGLLAAPCRRTASGGQGCEHFEPTGRLGVGWRGEGYTLFANVSRYQRQPTLGELYGAGVLVRGNAQLRPELGLSADVGARGSLHVGDWTLRAESNVFVRGASDLVTYVRTAQGYVVPVNGGERTSRAWSWELERAPSSTWRSVATSACSTRATRPRVAGCKMISCRSCHASCWRPACC
jgi:hypothetical protein